MGSSWFSLRTALMTASTLTPSASIAAGLRYRLICRDTPPTTLTEPTPRTFSSRFCSTCCAQVVSSCGDLRPSGDSTATLKIGVLAGSKRDTRGSLTSSRRVGRTSAIFSRTSSAALRPSTLRLNSMITIELPSYEREYSELMPATVLTASSIFLVTSVSTISGDAPG